MAFIHDPNREIDQSRWPASLDALPISSLGDALVFPKARVLPAMIDQNSELRLRNVQPAHMGYLRLQRRDRGCEPPAPVPPGPLFGSRAGRARLIAKAQTRRSGKITLYPGFPG
jgi:hypothetical protein